jgi:periplasmic divalent cation tolerance protein
VSPDPLDPGRAVGPMRIVVSNYPSRAAALDAMDAALARRLAACANLVPIDSRYWWNGRVEAARESMVLFKTVPKRVGALLQFLKASHPYEVPEVAELDVPRADVGYLAYLAATLDAAAVLPSVRTGARRRATPPGRAAQGPGRTQERHRRRSRRTESSR